MSGLLNKVKDAVTGHSTTHDTSTTGNTHTSGSSYDTSGNVGSGVHSSHTTGTGANLTHDGARTTGTGASGFGTSSNYGQHDSNIGNKLDPRVDSDRDGSRMAGNTSGGYGTGSSGLTSGQHGSDTYSSGTTGNTAGPHNSNLLNKLDPRVDNDRDGSRTIGGQTGTGITGTGTGHQHHGHHETGLLADKIVDPDQRLAGSHDTSYAAHGTHHGNHGMSSTFEDYTSTGDRHHHGTGVGSTTTGTGVGALGSSGYNSSNTTSGSHNSNIANKLDPRVDSDRDGSRTTGGYGNTATTDTGYGSTGTTGTNTGYGSTTTGGTAHTNYGSGAANYDNSPNPGSNTVAPHKSALLNKLDPRVDESQTYNSSTTGQNLPSVQHQGHHPGGMFSSGTNEGNYNDRDVNQSGLAGGRDSRDAAQVPPSQFQGGVTGNSKSGNAF